MSAPVLQNRSMSLGTFIPELGYPDVLQAAQWLSNAFGFSERLRIGTHRVQLTFGEGSVVVFHAEIPAAANQGKSHRIKVRVTGIDRHFEQAVRAGAIVQAPPTTHPYGERQYTVEDIAGHVWLFSESVADVHPQEWGAELLYSDTSSRIFYHGTRAELKPGDLMQPGFASNYTDRKSPWIYFSETLHAATWGAELAKGEGRGRIYIVEPTGSFVDDPNLTDKKFPGNPTKSYRSREPLRVVEELLDWQGHSPEEIQAMKDGIAGKEPIDD